MAKHSKDKNENLDEKLGDHLQTTGSSKWSKKEKVIGTNVLVVSCHSLYFVFVTFHFSKNG